MSEIDEVIATILVELKRGTLTLTVLSQLKAPQYGYSLLQRLEEREVAIEAGTLYPLLRRLEKQQLLESSWDTTESRPRKYYQLSEIGKLALKRLSHEWKIMNEQMMRLIEEDA